MTILVVEDEEPISEALQYSLKAEGFKIVVAATGEEGLSMARSHSPDLVILDVMLPKMSGIEVCKSLRKESDVPIIMLTARATETDKVVGIEVGADDYVTKPFSTKELVARIKAVMRRAKTLQKQQGPVVIGDLVIDERRQELKVKGETVAVSRKEFALLAFLVANRGQVFTRDAILDRVWGKDAYVEPHTVDVHVRWLRTKIEEDASAPRYIVTVRGVGYRFEGGES